MNCSETRVSGVVTSHPSCMRGRCGITDTVGRKKPPRVASKFLSLAGVATLCK